MLPRAIAPDEACLADMVGDVEPMEPVRGAGFLEEGAHPGAADEGVGGEIEADRQAGTEQRHQMRGYRAAQASGIAEIVGEAVLLARIEADEPGILADGDGVRLGAEANTIT